MARSLHILQIPTNYELSQRLQEVWELLFECTDEFAQQIVVVVHPHQELRQIHGNLRRAIALVCHRRSFGSPAGLRLLAPLSHVPAISRRVLLAGLCSLTVTAQLSRWHALILSEESNTSPGFRQVPVAGLAY